MRWRIVQCSVSGAAHNYMPGACQDGSFIVRNGQGLVIAAADGAGSAKCGRVGALIAVRSLAYAGRRLFSADISLAQCEAAVRGCFTVARRALKSAAVCFDVPLSALATTGILAIVTQKYAVVGQVGDGGCVLITSKGTLVTPVSPSNGRFANVTHFITDKDFRKQLQVGVHCGDLCGAALFTDGLQFEIIDVHGKARDQFLGPILRWMQESSPRSSRDQMLSFLTSDEVRERTDDDLTFVACMLAEKAQ